VLYHSAASQVVTEVDRMAQDIILKSLKSTISSYDVGLLTEESEDDSSRFEKDYFWCIDPLDGTLPFIESSPGYSVSIALVAKDGTPIIGVVYDPVKSTLYHAAIGHGAFKNENSWKVSSQPQNDKFTLISDRSFLQHPQFKEIDNGCREISKLAGLNSVELIGHGGGAINACWVLEYNPACYFKFPKTERGGGSLWDYAATSCILSEAGAHVSDIYGQMLDLNRSDSTFMNHKGILYASNEEIADHIMKLYKRLIKNS
jgi:3'-phosphoadenosine 5'-phosphosulfate (PAPS) 3'-phosphatase